MAASRTAFGWDQNRKLGHSLSGELIAISWNEVLFLLFLIVCQFVLNPVHVKERPATVI